MQEQVTIMMTYYRTDDQVIHEEEKLSDGVWVQMINPTHDECEEIWRSLKSIQSVLRCQKQLPTS